MHIFFPINHSASLSLNTMHGLIDHFTSVLWIGAIKCPHFVEAFFSDHMHLTYYIEVNTYLRELCFCLISLMEMAPWT